MPNFFDLAITREVIVISIKVALVVGTLLALINHGPAMFHTTMDSERLLQIMLTYLVPYSVATYSSVQAIRRRVVVEQPVD